MMREKVTEEMKEQIVAARKAGKMHSEIATEFGLSRSYVNNICLAAGLKTRKWERRTLSKADKENRMEELVRMLLHEKTDPIITRVGRLLAEMFDAGDGGSFYSDGNVGLNLTSEGIEIVDIRSGAVASLQLHFKKV